MSSHTSGITRSDLSGFSHDQQEISNLKLMEKKPMSSNWTDEKHSLYLKSMEASFVHQLYQSIESSGMNIHKKQPSQMRGSKHAQSHTAGQFKVRHNGCWQRIKVGRGEPPPQQSEDRELLLRNSWIQHYSPRVRDSDLVNKNVSIDSQSMHCGGRTMYTCGYVSQAYQDSSMSGEFSDQNFDEDDNEEGGMESLNMVKRIRTLEAGVPSKDQVKNDMEF